MVSNIYISVRLVPLLSLLTVLIIRVVQELEPVLVPRFKTMTKTHGLKGWTEIMKEQMNALHKLGRTAQDIREALHRIPVDVEIVEALKLINERGGTQFIVSDANEWFIDRVCEHHNISCCFKAIHSNKAHFNKDGKIIIEPYHSHSCKEDCPPNMCKADIVNKILGDEELLLGYRPLTVYIGVSSVCWWENKASITFTAPTFVVLLT